MGRLADLAKAKKLKGKVQVTFADGRSRVFANEAEAEKATAGFVLEHRRGAFFAEEAKVSAPALSTAPAEAPKKK